MSTLIGLSGKARSGKDSLAAHLVAEQGFARVAFADVLKDALAGMNPEVVGINRQHASMQGLLVAFDGWEGVKAHPNWAPAVRRLLQDLGVACREHVYADVWLDAAMRRVDEYLNAGTNVVITDMRFANEVEAVRGRGGIIARIERSDLLSDDEHVSENLLDDMSVLRPHIIIDSTPFESFPQRFTALLALITDETEQVGVVAA